MLKGSSGMKTEWKKMIQHFDFFHGWKSVLDENLWQITFPVEVFEIFENQM